MKKLLLITLAAALSISCSKEELDTGYQPDGKQVGITSECDSMDIEYYCVDEDTQNRLKSQVIQTGLPCVTMRFTDLQGNEVEGKFFIFGDHCNKVRYFD